MLLLGCVLASMIIDIIGNLSELAPLGVVCRANCHPCYEKQLSLYLIVMFIGGICTSSECNCLLFC